MYKNRREAAEGDKGMYRSMYWPGEPSDMCTRYPCDGKCRKYHTQEVDPAASTASLNSFILFIEAQKARAVDDVNRKTTSSKEEKEEQTPSTSRATDRLLPSTSSPTPSTSSSPDDDFKRIMRSAQNLIDPAYVEPPLPQPFHPAIKSARERKKRSKLARHLSIFEDTTKVNYQDGERSRPDSSDEEALMNLTVDPPSVIDEEDSSVDNLLRDVNKWDVHSNPVVHNHTDEHLFKDEDNDFIDDDIDLAVQRQLSVESHSSIKVAHPRRAEFERSLFEGSLDIPDLPPPTTTANGKKK